MAAIITIITGMNSGEWMLFSLALFPLDTTCCGFLYYGERGLGYVVVVCWYTLMIVDIVFLILVQST